MAETRHESRPWSFANLRIPSSGILNIASGAEFRINDVNLAPELAIAVYPGAAAEVVTTTNVITANEHGKTFFLNSATGFVSTLPAVALGLRFSFVVSLAVTTTAGHTIVCPAAAALFKGHVLTNDVNSGTDADFGTAGEATVTLVINKAIAGDRVDVICDGTNWFVRASCSVFDAITIS